MPSMGMETTYTGCSLLTLSIDSKKEIYPWYGTAISMERVRCKTCLSTALSKPVPPHMSI